MNKLIWKEFREITKWALLAFILLLAAGLYGLSASRERGDNYSNITFCHATFLMVTSFGYAIFGVALGCLQLLPELSRDQWATLLHRPVSRAKILFAKAIVGLTVYVICTALALLACLAYVLTPGNFATPFTPQLLLPALSDWCVGLSFYALTLLMCLHKGRWFGSRGILAIAGATLFVLHLVPRWPFSLPLFAFAIFMIAAAGAIHSSRSLRLRPTITRWAFIAAILLGCYGLTTLIFGGPQILRSNSHSYTFTMQGFVIASDGTVLRTFPSQDGSKNQMFDMEGKDVTEKYATGGERQFQYPNSVLYNSGKDKNSTTTTSHVSPPVMYSPFMA